MANISVIICTHNPRPEYLKRVLDALKAQTVPKVQWELLLIDNGSKEPLAPVWDLAWHPNARHIREDELGLTPARLRGIKESKGDVLVFVDDDNVLDSNYLEQTGMIAERWAILGVWGGQIRPEFEEEPPAWTQNYWGFLAIREFDRDYWSNVHTVYEAQPCGAGLCVRRVVAEFYGAKLGDDRKHLVLDRKGQSLMSSGDFDLVLTSCDLGMGMAQFKDLRLTHLMPKERLEEAYLLKLLEAIRYSNHLLRYYRKMPTQLPSKNIFWWLRYFRNLATRSKRERRFYLAEVRAENMARAVFANASKP